MTAKALLLAAAIAAVALPAAAEIVAYDVDITIDQLPPGSHFKIGDHHNARIIFDTAAVDAAGKAPLLHLQHMKSLVPATLDPVAMPMGNSFVLTKASPMAFHYGALPPSGMSTLFDEKTRRITIRNATTGELTLAGPYVITPTPITGPQIDAAVGKGR